MSQRRVVITGLGLLTPIGKDAAAFWDGLVQGKSGVRLIQSFDTSGLPIRIAGEIDGFDAKKYIDKKERKNLRVMARPIQLAVAASQLALDDGKVDEARLDPARFGVEFGAGLIASELPELGPASKLSANGAPPNVDMARWGEQGLAAITPLWMLKYLPNMHACHVSVMHNAQGPNNTITESDVAPLLALGEATRILRRDQADLFLVGGADSKVNPLSMMRQNLFNHLSKRQDVPSQACRPFEKNRDGIVAGEGAGVLCVEDLQHAQRRGAPIVAEVTGFGSGFDRGRTGRGLARAIRAALAQGGVKPDDVDHVNAHGLGSPAIDVWEAKGIHEVFGSATPVWAVKSYTGSMGAGGPLAELSASLLALKHRTLPATLNYDEPDPACPVAVQKQARPVTKPYVLKVSYTELGQCAAVLCRTWEGA
ncbi:MAG: beta-ketoacyl-[acyl-carrier-protein] synthase family protein [Gemmataceae bacterium]|nr:beta-ketoacyl-[acyl-carrier-protein] synthase family protein [Gemmataceae bacterium]